jgi:hypothetical protein
MCDRLLSCPAPTDVQMANTYTGVYIPTGITEVGLVHHLVRWQATRVLDFRNVVPGTFGGFTDASLAKRVDDETFVLFTDKKWCCSGEQPMAVHKLEWQYALPQPLADRVQSPGAMTAPHRRTPIPQYLRPAFCDDIHTDPHNAQFLAFDNHPCMYLGAGIVFPSTVEELFA